MAHTSEFINFRTCCRLCLAENCVLSNIFTSNQGTSDFADKIFSFLGIMVTVKDRITISICEKCFLYVNNYEHFRNVSHINQIKLYEQMRLFDSRILHETIKIKGDDEPDDVVFVSSELLKKESNDTVSCPQVPTIEVVEDGKDIMETFEIISEDDVMPLDLLVPLQKELPEQLEKSPTLDTSISNDTTSIISEHNTSGDDVDLAADDVDDVADDVQVEQTMDINMEAFTRAEVQYERRMQLIYTQMALVRCGCHNRPYLNKYRLNHHMRNQRSQRGICMPKLTCFRCCTTFTRHFFTKHVCGRRLCVGAKFAKMRDIGNATERGVGKHRNYQAFKCALCGAVARLRETFVQHVDEHLLDCGAAALRCGCGEQCVDAHAYREHLLGACVMKPCCDLCDVSFGSIEEFRAHCAERHDGGDGEHFHSILEEFQVLELPFTPKYACAECGLRCTQESFIVQHLRIGHGYDLEAAKRVGAKCYIKAEENSPDAAPVEVVSAPPAMMPPPPEKSKVAPSSASFKFNCLICGAGYDDGDDMRSHFVEKHPYILCL